MIIYNVARLTLETALQLTNTEYDGNLTWDYIRQTGHKRFQLRLRVLDSSKKGARLGFTFRKDGNRRHLINACWHAHGDFFEYLLKSNPEAIIKVATHKIYVNNCGHIIGNWQDRNIGSMMYPLMYSEACECT